MGKKEKSMSISMLGLDEMNQAYLLSNISVYPDMDYQFLIFQILMRVRCLAGNVFLLPCGFAKVSGKHK